LELIVDPNYPTGYSPFPKSIAAWDLSAILPESDSEIRRERSIPGAISQDSQGNVLLVDEGNAAILLFDKQMRYIRAITVPEIYRPGRFVDATATPDGNTIYGVERNSCSVFAFDREGKLKSRWGRRGSEAGDEFISPSGIAVDAEGAIFISDSSLNDVRKFDSSGRLMARWGGNLTERAAFHCPQSLSIPKANFILVDDVGHHCARLITPDGIESFPKGGLPRMSAPDK